MELDACAAHRPSRPVSLAEGGAQPAANGATGQPSAIVEAARDGRHDENRLMRAARAKATRRRRLPIRSHLSIESIESIRWNSLHFLSFYKCPLDRAA